MVIKNLENKIKLVLIICSLFLVGCVVISLGSIWTARGMVSDAHQKVYVLDGNVPVLVNRSIITSSLLHLTTSTSSTRWRKLCTSSTRQVWHNTMP